MAIPVVTGAMQGCTVLMHRAMARATQHVCQVSTCSNQLRKHPAESVRGKHKTFDSCMGIYNSYGAVAARQCNQPQ